MHISELVYDLIMNIAVLALAANLLSRLQPIQDMILQEKRSVRGDILLSVVFGGIIILSSCMGVDIGSYSLNTRTIGAMAAGLLGGPLVGLYSSSIGALYVLMFSTPQVFAKGSAFATILVGLLGAGFYPYFQRGKWKYRDLFLLACFAEICDMAALLRMTVSLQVAVETILDITIPMILVNAVGLLIFIASFNMVFIRQDLESSRQLNKLSELSKRCIPLLREGLYVGENIRKIASAILEETDWSGVMITSREVILECRGEGIEWESEKGADIPDIGKQALENGEVMTLQYAPETHPWHELMRDHSVVAAPLVVKEKAIGCMIVCMKKQWMVRKSEMELLQHLMILGSSQIAMLELERQEAMLRKAEFKALQFQVNPHFLFNALNTISCVCREDPERARELLVILANYFRYNLDYEAYMVPLKEELEHVRDYLELEKARFEEKLTVTYDVPEKLDVTIPTLILQPIVENAVRHGIDAKGRRMVHIQICEEKEAYVVYICDKGLGFREEVLEKLKNDEPIGSSIGLSNVHKRMKSIYGEEGGLKIKSSDEGSTVELRFLKQ